MSVSVHVSVCPQGEHKEELVKLTDALLERHSLTGGEVAALLVRARARCVRLC